MEDEPEEDVLRAAWPGSRETHLCSAKAPPGRVGSHSHLLLLSQLQGDSPAPDSPVFGGKSGGPLIPQEDACGCF